MYRQWLPYLLMIFGLVAGTFAWLAGEVGSIAPGGAAPAHTAATGAAGADRAATTGAVATDGPASPATADGAATTRAATPVAADGPATTNEVAPRTLEAARAFYAAQSPLLRPRPYTPVPQGLVDLRAESCGACHREIYAEWRISTHARAWLDDPQFQAELEKSGRDGKDVRWMCVNCHTPLENQLEKLVVGLTDGRVEKPILIPNPGYDPKLQLDAITCATCHVREGVVYGPYGDTRAPHPVRRDPDLLTSKVCTSCHQAQAEFPEISLACAFDTGAELAAGPYGKRGDTCQTCHMPAVDRPLTPGTPVRHTRYHWFGGSLIAKKPAFVAELEPLKAFFHDGLTLSWRPLPAALNAGSSTTLEFDIENTWAGHALPTGDPERFILIDAEVRDTTGRVLAVRKERIGQEWEWWPKVRKRADNRLEPKERRRFSVSFDVPAAGPVTLHLRASKWRISEENLKYHHLEEVYVPGRVFFDEAREVAVR